MQVTWEQFKSFVDVKSISIQYVEFTSHYKLSIVDAGFFLVCVLDKNPSNTADLDDFESNYKSLGNKNIKNRVITSLGNDDYILNPTGIYISGTKETTTNHDLLLNYPYALKGGVIHMKTCEWGDYIQVLVIDKDDVLGAGGTEENPFQLVEYIAKWYITPGHPNELINYAVGQLPIGGLYIRTVYHSISGSQSNPEGVLNVISYVSV